MCVADRMQSKCGRRGENREQRAAYEKSSSSTDGVVRTHGVNHRVCAGQTKSAPLCRRYVGCSRASRGCPVVVTPAYTSFAGDEVIDLVVWNLGGKAPKRDVGVHIDHGIQFGEDSLTNLGVPRGHPPPVRERAPCRPDLDGLASRQNLRAWPLLRALHGSPFAMLTRTSQL